MNSINKVYFPNLNGLRFIAAFMVIIHHLEQLLNIYGYHNYWDNRVIAILGILGVKLFFVLSGFLLTYLLLAEERENKKISIKNFYIRRILRIWPLYYIVITLSFFLLNRIELFNIPYFTDHLNENLWSYFTLFLFLIPNVALYNKGAIVPYATQSWSVGVEEQFYLLWPILIRFFKNKLLLLLGVIISIGLLKHFGFDFIKKYIYWNNFLDEVEIFIRHFSIDSMAVGGLFALILFEKYTLLKYLLINIVLFLSIGLTIFFISFSIKVPFVDAYAILFALIILNLAANKTVKNLMENVILKYLGKISYGLYMYHVVVIVFAIKLFNYWGLLQNHLLLLLFSTLLTILLASLSYKFIEKFFISFKTRFSTILSGDNIK